MHVIALGSAPIGAGEGTLSKGYVERERKVMAMRAIAVVGWVVIIGALLAWQGFGLVIGPRWPTLSDMFRAFMRPLLGRFVLLGLWLWLGWHLFIRGWRFFLRS